MKLNMKVANGKLTVLNDGFNKVDFPLFIYYSNKHDTRYNYDLSDIVDFAKNNKGIVIKEDDTAIYIYNDPFRTLPLFVTKDKAGNILIYSDFKDYFAFDNIEKNIDEIGFWETVLYGGGLWTRTIFKNTKQMVASSYIVINKEKNDYEIIRYWDYSIPVDDSIISIEQATQGLYERLDLTFSKLPIDKKILMGLSGGVDSRLSIAFLSKIFSRDKIKLFTYGFDSRVLEFRYAGQVAEALNLRAPEFHKIRKDSYIKAIDSLVVESGGQIGLQHCHAYDYFADDSGLLNDYVHISTLYSDAILGWDAIHPKRSDNQADVSYYKAMDLHIDSSIKSEINEDISNVVNIYSNRHGFTSVNEFKYVTERNIKFHTYLAFLYNKYIDTIVPFADYELLTYVISVPSVFRSNKKWVDFLLNKYFPEISLDKIGNISSRFQWGPKFAGYIPYIHSALLNRIGAVSLFVSNGEISIFNKYFTEVWREILFRDLYDMLLKSIDCLKRKGLISEKQVELLSKRTLSIKSEGLAERFQLIGLAKLIEKI